ncbi:hypothetical protein CRUP_006673 [Coryphaenoides rupestris]|nr:hypothetical protein CRUP_006673 [Coryphaenoides rupestris]
MSQRDTLVHLFAGGCGGTVGAILTCPLEVVKTRLQSSSVTFYISEVQLSTVNGPSVARMTPPGPIHCLKAIYFAAYSTAKEKLNGVLEPDSTQVHMVSAGLAGFTAITATNPIWLIKTRLQLDARCVRRAVPAAERLCTASTGAMILPPNDRISETVHSHFVHTTRASSAACCRQGDGQHGRRGGDGQGRLRLPGHECWPPPPSKTCATSIAYPHGDPDAATRGGQPLPFLFPHAGSTAAGGGYRALYRGLTTTWCARSPTRAIMMATYELVVYLLPPLAATETGEWLATSE